MYCVGILAIGNGGDYKMFLVVGVSKRLNIADLQRSNNSITPMRKLRLLELLVFLAMEIKTRTLVQTKFTAAR